MAKATLPTNYQDDILNVSTEGKRKYRMVYNDDGTVSFDDVTPYDQEGSDFGAGDINAINEAVNQSFDKNKLIRDMDAIGALTQEGYAPDALALKEVNDSLNNMNMISVIGSANINFSTGGTITLSESYKNFKFVAMGSHYYPLLMLPSSAIASDVGFYIHGSKGQTFVVNTAKFTDETTLTISSNTNGTAHNFYVYGIK